MAYGIGDLIVRILGDDADFQKKIKGVDKKADKASKSVGKSFDVMKIKSIAMGVASAAAVIKTIDFLKDSTLAAINAQETFSKFDVVFSEMGSAAENAAKSFQDSFDLASVTAKKMLADTGNLLSGFGATQSEALDLSVQVNTLASDLASFTNYSGGAEGASQALTKALLGERESLKQLGIVIREEDINIKLAQKGQEKLTGNALNLAKAQATLEIALEQGKNAIGDYERTHDSAANTLNRAKEATTELQVAIGTALSPSVSLLGGLWATVATELAKVIKANNDLKDAIKSEGTEEDSIEKRILRLEEERKQLQANLNLEKVYDEEGRLIRTAAYESAERSLKQNEAIIKGLKIQRDQEALNARTKQDAQAAIENFNKIELEQDEEKSDRLEKQKAITQAFLAQADELNWRVNQGLTSEKEEREALYQATVQQIDSLYQLYAQTGDQSILTGEAMQDAIERAETLGSTTTDIAHKMVIDWETIAKDGIGTALEGFSQLGEAMANGELSWSDFGKIGLKVIADTIRAVAAEMAAFAALEIAKAGFFNPIGWAASAGTLALSAGLYTSAGLIEGLAANMQSGGIVEPTENGAIVRVAENNSGEVLFNTGESGQAFIQQMGKAIAAELEITAILQTESEKLAEIVMRPVRDGRVRGER